VQRLHVGGRDVRNVGPAVVDRLDLPGVEVDAGRVESRLGELHGEGQSDVAEPDDAGAGGTGPNLFSKHFHQRSHRQSLL
jgi:hypothetical protein